MLLKQFVQLAAVLASAIPICNASALARNSRHQSTASKYVFAHFMVSSYRSLRHCPQKEEAILTPIKGRYCRKLHSRRLEIRYDDSNGHRHRRLCPQLRQRR